MLLLKKLLRIFSVRSKALEIPWAQDRVIVRLSVLLLITTFITEVSDFWLLELGCAWALILRPLSSRWVKSVVAVLVTLPLRAQNHVAASIALVLLELELLIRVLEPNIFDGPPVLQLVYLLDAARRLSSEFSHALITWFVLNARTLLALWNRWTPICSPCTWTRVYFNAFDAVENIGVELSVRNEVVVSWQSWFTLLRSIVSLSFELSLVSHHVERVRLERLLSVYDCNIRFLLMLRSSFLTRIFHPSIEFCLVNHVRFRSLHLYSGRTILIDLASRGVHHFSDVI